MTQKNRGEILLDKALPISKSVKKERLFLISSNAVTQSTYIINEKDVSKSTQ